MKYLKINKRQLRFVIAGTANTLFNFLVLNLSFYALHESKLVSSFIATSCAIILSFLLNRNFVFKHKQNSWREPLVFIVVTVSGVLLIQNTIYDIGIHLFVNHTAWLINPIYALSRVKLSYNFVEVNVSNVIGSLGALIWNYNGYRLFVFKGHKENILDEVEIPS